MFVSSGSALFEAEGANASINGSAAQQRHEEKGGRAVYPREFARALNGDPDG